MEWSEDREEVEDRRIVKRKEKIWNGVKTEGRCEVRKKVKKAVQIKNVVKGL